MVKIILKRVLAKDGSDIGHIEVDMNPSLLQNIKDIPSEREWYSQFAEKLKDAGFDIDAA